jgi:hypothetical protein
MRTALIGYGQKFGSAQMRATRLSCHRGSSTMPDAKPASGPHAHRSVVGRLARVLIAVLLVASVGLAA